MKIAVNTRFLLKTNLEGIGWFTYETLRRMVERHPEDEFIFFFDRPFEPEYIFGKNVTPVVLFPPARHPFLFVAWFDLAVAWALRKHRPDVFYSPDGFLSLLTAVPTLLVVHDIAHVHYPTQVGFFQRKYYDFFIPKFLKKSSHIVTVSEFSKQDIIREYGIENSKISVVANGCRTVFVPLSESDVQSVRKEYSGGQPYFFYVGAIHPRKNVARLIEAFDIFKQKNNSSVKLLLGGRMAWQTGEVKSAWELAKSHADIKFLGYLDAQKLAQLTAAAVAITYVSLLEGFGVPLLEAMYCDVPLITSRSSSMPEVAGDAAILVNPMDASAIAEAMERVTTDNILRAQLVEKGRAQRQKFDWNDSAEKIYEVLKKIKRHKV